MTHALVAIQLKSLSYWKQKTEEKNCLVFLPNRFNAYINEDKVDELNLQSYVMTYSGKVKTQRNRVKLSFDLMKDIPLTSNADTDVKLQPDSSYYRKNIIKTGKTLGSVGRHLEALDWS